MTEEITFEEFQKVDIRVGIILTAEAIPKSKKLIKLLVDLGQELGTRTILAGLAPVWNPIELEHKRVLVVTNLAPRNMMGIESHGMLLAVDTPAETGDRALPREFALVEAPRYSVPGGKVG